MNHILSVLKVPQDRDSGFIALGEMALALDGELSHYLPTISTHLREAVRYIICYQMPDFCCILFYSCRMFPFLFRGVLVYCFVQLHMTRQSFDSLGIFINVDCSA